tara:strand:+ start:221 stop:640 length:420 start_codon:yes stop_codon:yes gene_type:complete
MVDRSGKFRGARFVSKRTRRIRHADNTRGLKTFDGPPSIGHLRRGRVYHARVPLQDDPSTTKIRPVMFLRPINHDTAEVLAVFSRFDRTARPQSVRVVVNRRRCFVWLRPIHIPRVDIISETAEVLDPDDLGGESDGRG